MRERWRRLIEWYESERYRRTYGRMADHSHAYAAAKESRPQRLSETNKEQQ